MTAVTDAPLLDAAWKQKFRKKLLAWYDRNARDLPWRKSRDPYRVWVSEVMLQQTQVDTVRPYFERFIKAFPTVSDLAKAREQRVLKLWEGLGYYRRARALHAAAKEIVKIHQGCIPDDTDALLNLPGVGRYTAGAILSIAFDKRAPILEANTIRLFSRLIAYQGDPTRAAGQKILWRTAEELLPQKNIARFNQSLMELGSLVCKPKLPDCDACPVNKLCKARAEGVIDRLQPTTQRVAITDVREAAVVVRKQGHVLLRVCGDSERWAGLWDFPRFPIDSESESAMASEIVEKVYRQTGVQCEIDKRFQTIRHGVTRYRITLDCYDATRVAGRVRHGATWYKPSELQPVPLSVTGRKIARLVGA